MLKKLKTRLFLIFILIISFGISCVNFREDDEFNNPVDPEAPNYNGVPSVDLDGDGISAYIDVDDIILISPADGTVTSDGTPTLIVYKFDPSLVKRYHIQISTSENDFENYIVHQNPNISINYYSIPAGVLENNTTYYWRAKAHDDIKWSDNWSESYSLTLDITIDVPTIPNPKDESIIIDTTPELEWEDVYDATGYYIQINTEIDFNGTMIVDEENVIQSYYQVSTVLESNTTYYWRVRIKNEEEIWGDWSATWSFIIEIPVNPLPPNGGSTIDTTPLLNWDDVTGAFGYDVQIADSEAGLESANIVEVTASEYQIESAYNYGETKYWRVRAVNEDGIAGAWGGPWSYIVSWDYNFSGISPLDGGNTFDTTPLLNWDDVTGAFGYDVQIADSEAGLESANIVEVTASEYQIESAYNYGETKYWRVRAVNEDGIAGAWGGPWSYIVSWDYNFSGISPLDGGNTFDTTPLLNWDDVTGAFGYDVQIADSEAGLESANIVEVTASEYQITNELSIGDVKHWRVRAVNEDGIEGTWSDTWQFEVIEHPVTSINNELASHGLSMRVVVIISEETDTYRDMTLTSYALSETEVTQGDYEAVVGSNPPSGHPEGEYGVGDNYPVYYVLWYDAVEFCNALSTLLGLEEVYNELTWEADFTKNGFYLPTDAQWEYAAGGPNHYTWPLGDTFNSSDYVYDDTQTRPVKSKPANGFGLYHMGGNVWEWCNDWYGHTFPHTGETDPTGPISGSRRIVRGGGWGDYRSSSDLRSESRGSWYPSRSINPPFSNGFRVAVGGHGSWLVAFGMYK